MPFGEEAMEVRNNRTKKFPREKNTSGKFLVVFTRYWLNATGFHT